MTFLYPLLKIHRKVEIKCSVENTFKNAGLLRPCFQGGFNIVVVHDKNQKILKFQVIYRNKFFLRQSAPGGLIGGRKRRIFYTADLRTVHLER